MWGGLFCLNMSWTTWRHLWREGRGGALLRPDRRKVYCRSTVQQWYRPSQHASAALGALQLENACNTDSLKTCGFQVLRCAPEACALWMAVGEGQQDDNTFSALTRHTRPAHATVQSLCHTYRNERLIPPCGRGKALPTVFLQSAPPPLPPPLIASVFTPVQKK